MSTESAKRDLETIAHITKLRAKQAILLDQLRLWKEVESQGIDPETVESFTFREEFLTRLELEHVRNFLCGSSAHGHLHNSVALGKELLRHFNCVRLKNGELVRLDPPLLKAMKEEEE